MKTLMYVTELPSMNRQLVEATRKERKAQAAYRASLLDATPKPLGPPEETPPQPSASVAPEAPLSEPESGPVSAAPKNDPPLKKDGVLYPDEVHNVDGTTNLKEPGTGLAAPPPKGETGWTGSVQDRADEAAGKKSPADKSNADNKPKNQEGFNTFTKAILGAVGYKVLGQISSAMDSTERQRSEPQGYTGAGIGR